MAQGKKTTKETGAEAKAPARAEAPREVSEFTGAQMSEAAEKLRQRAAPPQESMILKEGEKAEEDAGWFTKKTYATWNSIPWAHAPQIAVELWATIFKQRSFGGQKEALGLKPNYVELNFTPLENSFTRRPNGFLNWWADVLGGKPYRILSDMKDGVLYSPKGGSLEGVFPGTMVSMLNDPMGLGILKKERIGQLETLLKTYEKDYSDLGKMSTEELFGALERVGDENSVMFYRQGFRDSLVEMSENMIGAEIVKSGLNDNEKKLVLGQIMAFYSEFNTRVANRGYGRKGIERADTGFVDMKYRLPDLGKLLVGDAKKAYMKLPEETRSKMERLFKIREEMAQEGTATIGAVEYCRSTLYRISAELGKKLAAEGKLRNADDVHFLTVQELGDVVGGAEADQALIDSRRKALSELK